MSVVNIEWNLKIHKLDENSSKLKKSTTQDKIWDASVGQREMGY